MEITVSGQAGEGKSIVVALIKAALANAGFTATTSMTEPEMESARKRLTQALAFVTKVHITERQQRHVFKVQVPNDVSDAELGSIKKEIEGKINTDKLINANTVYAGGSDKPIGKVESETSNSNVAPEPYMFGFPTDLNDTNGITCSGPVTAGRLHAEHGVTGPIGIPGIPCNSRLRLPVGLRPKEIAMKSRLIEISEAMHRYLYADKLIPQEWLDEYQSLHEFLHDAKGNLK